MDHETLTKSLTDQESPQTPLNMILRKFLSTNEAIEIIRQFRSSDWIENGQVLWSGIPREKAQDWADKHGLQTLTTAMGPLMDTKNPNCLRSRKNKQKWSQYVHGASAIFAWCIAQGEIVTLLAPPPPERFHPSGLSYYQTIEEPIIRGLAHQISVRRIDICHPAIKESTDFLYELWPNDRSATWVERFGSKSYQTKWRKIGNRKNTTKLASSRNLKQKKSGGKDLHGFQINEVSFLRWSSSISSKYPLIELSRAFLLNLLMSF